MYSVTPSRPSIRTYFSNTKAQLKRTVKSTYRRMPPALQKVTFSAVCAAGFMGFFYGIKTARRVTTYIRATTVAVPGANVNLKIANAGFENGRFAQDIVQAAQVFPPQLLQRTMNGSGWMAYGDEPFLVTISHPIYSHGRYAECHPFNNILYLRPTIPQEKRAWVFKHELMHIFDDATVADFPTPFNFMGRWGARSFSSHSAAASVIEEYRLKRFGKMFAEMEDPASSASLTVEEKKLFESERAELHWAAFPYRGQRFGNPDILYERKSPAIEAILTKYFVDGYAAAADQFSLLFGRNDEWFAETGAYFYLYPDRLQKSDPNATRAFTVWDKHWREAKFDLKDLTQKFTEALMSEK